MKTPKLFDARFDGVYSFKSVLANHKQADKENPVMDGILWMVEKNPSLELMQKRVDNLTKDIDAFSLGMLNQPYIVWKTLDEKRYFFMCRRQLLNLAIDFYSPYR